MNDSEKKPGILAGNLGEPTILSDINLCGVSAKAGREGEQIEVWTLMALMSDDALFHKIVGNLVGAIEGFAQRQGKSVALRRADTVLMVIRPDRSAELWVDAAAMTTSVMVKRPLLAGSVVFESDIADVTGMDFPLVEIGEKDQVFCLFRVDWRFGLFFDFNPEGALDRSRMRQTLGALHRTMRYRHLYDVVSNANLFDHLVQSGWFPFAEIIHEFRDLANASEAGFDLQEVETELIAAFGETRLSRMFDRWMNRAHLKDREVLLRSAINSYIAGEPAATIKIVLTEIEGALCDAYRAQHGKGAKLKTLLQFACQSAESRAGGGDTLLFSDAFANYLATYTFANFDPNGPKGSAGSRHAVGHGAADPASYTMTRALQALLTMDQFAFYT